MPDREEKENTLAADRKPSAIMGALDTGFRYARWGIALLLALYLFSGITVVEPDEVGMILRFGRLVGAGPATQVRKPGLVYKFPRPIDELVRVKIKKVFEIEIKSFFRPEYIDQVQGADKMPFNDSIDPENEGYCLTGDHNVVQTLITVKYQITDPIAYKFGVYSPEDTIRDAVMTAMVRSTGEKQVDSIITEGKKVLLSTVRQRAQKRLDDVNAGITIQSFEFNELMPARQVLQEFKAVQNAFIEKETKIKEARSYREEKIPSAEASAGMIKREAQAYAADVLSSARGEAGAFEDLLAQYRKDPQVVRERMYREAIDDAMSWLADVTVVPVDPKSQRQGVKVILPGK